MPAETKILSCASLAAKTCALVRQKIHALQISKIIFERVPQTKDEHISPATPAKITVQYLRGDSRPLDPRFDVRCHSPSGFSWGYCGSGPAQLALAVLIEVTGSVRFAEAHYQEFKSEVIAAQQSHRFELPASDLWLWIEMRLDPFIESAISGLFREDGTLPPYVFMEGPTGGPDFDLIWDDGHLYLVTGSSDDDQVVKSEVTNIPEFYADAIFFAKGRKLTS